MDIPKSFLGYKRENGRAGTRNHVIILPVDDISNACAEAVSNNIKGTIALPHSYGRLQFGADLELHFRTMIGTGKNPNVAAVIVIGIEPKWTKRIVDAIAKTGKPVEGFSIEGVGDIDTIAKVSKKAFLETFAIVSISPTPSILNPSTGFPVFAIASTILLVHLGSIPITMTAATLGFLPVPIIVLKCNSRSAPNCNLP